MSGPCGHEHHELGGHHHDHSKCDHDDDDKASEQIVHGVSLQRYIDLGKCRVDNAENPDDLFKVFKEYEDRKNPEGFIESDCDEELLIFIQFTEVLRIKGLVLLGGTGEDDAAAPSKAKLYINRDDVDFDKASELAPVQEINLLSGPHADTEYALKTSKFTAVRNLTIVIPANFGADTTLLSCIHFRGTSTKITTNRVIMEAVYESQGRLQDHKVRGVGQAMPEGM
eukprot:TRINITY_DN1292_c0_g3_i1.p1 TRINITY_DN1292_c0_g3~~TRINITY_DN1292_c0_g3_i1.p1  ORF type:complete len:226 (+),score=83.04 TRINITY_DN1292_c0_g3_i1:132-809(+)